MSRSDQAGFRRYLPLVLLAAVALVAAAIVLLLPAIRQAVPAKNNPANAYTPTYKTVAQKDAQALQTITVRQRDMQPYTMLYQDGVLYLEKDGDPEPVNPRFAEQLVQYATVFSVEDTVTEDISEVAEYLAEMGLDPPQIQVDITYTDGSSASLSLGALLPDTPYHYYRWSGDDGLYLCNPGIYETLEYTPEMLLTFTQPPIYPALIQRITITGRDAESIVCTFQDHGGDAPEGRLESPFAYPMSAEATDALLAAVKNFRLGARLQPITAATQTLYGLDNPMAIVEITQGEGYYSLTDSSGAMQSIPLDASSVTLTIGSRDGDFFYYCGYDGTAYRVAGFLVSAFLQADAAGYISRTPADLGTGNMQRIELQAGDGRLNLHAQYTEQVLPNNELAYDEDGNVLYTVDVTANGEPISAESFLLLVQRLARMTVSGPLEAAQTPAGTPRWQLTLADAQGKTRTLCAYPMDAFHDVLSVDGVALSYISNEALDIALGDIAALLEPSGSP